MRAFAVVAAVILCATSCARSPHPRSRLSLDLNAASASELAALPALSRDDAERIVAARPYHAKGDLLRRGVVTRDQYAAIEPDVYVGPPGTPDYLRAVPVMPKAP